MIDPRDSGSPTASSGYIDHQQLKSFPPGFLDGRVARLGGVIGRPEFSNSISYPWTGLFTQTLAGKDYELPGGLLTDGKKMGDLFLPCSSLGNNVKGILHCCTAALQDLGHNRVVQVGPAAPSETPCSSQVGPALQLFPLAGKGPTCWELQGLQLDVDAMRKLRASGDFVLCDSAEFERSVHNRRFLR